MIQELTKFSNKIRGLNPKKLDLLGLVDSLREEAVLLKKKSVFIIIFSLTSFFIASSYALAIPALVVGDVEVLVPLTYTSYLEGYPVLFFTDQLDSKQIMKILEKSSTVIFANEAFYNLVTDTLDSQYRYDLFDQTKPISFTTEIEGVYEIWAKRGKKEKSKDGELRLFIDDKEVVPRGNRQQGRRWISLGKTKLVKRKHTIRLTGSIEELLIMPEEEVEKHRLKIEKLINTHNLDIGYLFWSEKSGLTEKSLYLPCESRYRVKVRERVDPIQIKNIGLSLKMGSRQEAKKWSFSSTNVDYGHFIRGAEELVLTSSFDGDANEQEFVEMKRESIKLDLEEYPYFDLIYELEDRNVQRVEVIFGIDFDGDGAVDGYFRTDKSKENSSLNKFNLYHAVNVEFPGKSHYALTHLKLLAGKIKGVDCSGPEKGIYNWEFGDIRLYSLEAGLIPGWRSNFEKMSTLVDSLRMKNLGLNLEMGLAKELKKWSFDSSGVAYEYSMAEGGLLELSIHLDGDRNEEEFVEMRRKDLNLDLEKYLYFGLTYRLQDPGLQVIDVVFGVDFDDDGMVDEYIPLRKKVALKNWKKIGAANKTMHFYETRLPADWPLFLNTRHSGKGKFRVYKNGISVGPTWYRWDDNKELVEVGRDGYNRLVITVPKDENPRDSVYMVSYLPLAIKNQVFPGLDRIQINIEQLVKEKFPGKKDYFLTELRLIFGKAEGVDYSGPEKNGWYTYQIKNVDFEQYSSLPAVISVGDGDFEKKSLRLDARNTEYSYFITDNGALSLNTYFDGGISPSSKEEKIRETEDEYVKLTIPGLDFDINEYPFLDITYKLQHPEVQHIDGELDIDLTGDGKVDKSISLRKEKELILGNWREFPSIYNKTMDLYQTGLPEEWPKTYTSQYSSPDRFTVYKNGIPMQTNWHRWDDEREWVEMDGPWKRVIIAVRKGESPNDSVYKAKFRYIPSVKRSEIFAGFDRMHIDIKERLEETFGEQANPRSVNVRLHLKKAKDIDCSSPDKRRVYSFEIKDVNVYRYTTLKEMVSSKNRWFRKMPLFRIAEKSYSGDDIDKITVESDSLWCEIADLRLGPGNYRFSPVMQEGFEMNLALIEPDSVSRSARSPGKATQIEFRRINPTRYRVQAKTGKSFWLVFSESFHSEWKAYIRWPSGVRGHRMDFEWSAVLSALRDWGNRIELKEHYPVNGYANAWWVPVEELTAIIPERKYQAIRPSDDSKQPGMKEFEIILEFKPQRLFEIGVVISLATLLGCVGYLIRDFMRKKKTKC